MACFGVSAHVSRMNCMNWLSFIFLMRSAPLRLALIRLASLRLAPLRSSHNGCCSLHVFQAMLPCFSTSRCAGFAMSCPPLVSCHYSACGELQQEFSPG